MNWLELILGQVLEAVYLSLFMIYTKRLDKHKIAFTLMMILEYVILINTIDFSLWVYVLYFTLAYMILKILHKKKSQIIDVFTLGIACLSIIVVNIIAFLLVMLPLNNYIVFVLVARISLFALLFKFKDKLPSIQKLYIHLWNRDDKVKKKIKSTTFRCMNVVLLNSIFYLLNIGILVYNIMRR